MGAVAAIALLCMDLAPPWNLKALINVAFSVIFVLLLRKAFVTRAMYNPLGANRDFSPASSAAGCIAYSAHMLSIVDIL